MNYKVCNSISKAFCGILVSIIDHKKSKSGLPKIILSNPSHIHQWERERAANTQKKYTIMSNDVSLSHHKSHYHTDGILHITDIIISDRIHTERGHLSLQMHNAQWVIRGRVLFCEFSFIFLFQMVKFY